jgi:hypothetical protein
MLFHIDSIPLLSRFVSRDGLFGWVRANKVLSLIITEVINLGMHGANNSNVTTFVLGSTLMNTAVIFGVLPIAGHFFGLGKRKLVA